MRLTYLWSCDYLFQLTRLVSILLTICRLISLNQRVDTCKESTTLIGAS